MKSPFAGMAMAALAAAMMEPSGVSFPAPRRAEKPTDDTPTRSEKERSKRRAARAQKRRNRKKRK